MALERTYNVPLRIEWLKVPKYKRAKKAVTALREFLQRHMKSETVLIGKYLNNAIWHHGMRNPPHHIKVDVVKGDDGVARAEISGKKYHELTKADKEAKKPAAGTPLGKLQEKLGAKPEKKAEEKEEHHKSEHHAHAYPHPHAKKEEGKKEEHVKHSKEKPITHESKKDEKTKSAAKKEEKHKK